MQRPGLTQTRARNEQAFRDLTDPHQRALQLHCYRMLGSVQDAEDTLQETLLAAWRGFDSFEGRSSVRSWLYQIATNRCLNVLRERSRRPRHARSPGSPPFAPPPPTLSMEPPLLEPYPDALLDNLTDASANPEARYEVRESVELAFVTALLYLPPRQRAVIILRDVLGFRAEAIARMLETTPGSVKGALQRARQTLASRLPAANRLQAPLPGSEDERALASRFADAFEHDDIDQLLLLLTEDARLTMPPFPHAYVGPQAIGDFLRASAAWRGLRAYRLVPVRANSQPAFAIYLQDAHGTRASAAGLIVLTLTASRLSGLTRFMETSLFRHFGLPPTLP
ncbi:MAG: RNA polymerase subunit sigma-70 [Chloroflexi bacterium]|nr:RNA polymerase subunit sigma-70 [Chloroflexota bacterium]